MQKSSAFGLQGADCILVQKDTLNGEPHSKFGSQIISHVLYKFRNMIFDNEAIVCADKKHFIDKKI